MLRNIMNLKGAYLLTVNDQKNLYQVAGACVDSNTDCTALGNFACPIGQGCYFVQDSVARAVCKCF